MPNRGTRVGPYAADRRPETRHPFVPGGEPKPYADGRLMRTCATCGYESRSHPPEFRDPARRTSALAASGQLEIADLAVRPWEVDALAHLLDRLLEGDAVGWRTRVRLLDVRHSLAADYPGLIVRPVGDLIATEEGGDQVATPPPPPRYAERPPTANPERASRKMRSGLRHPEVRRLFDRMVDEGWQPRAARGGGHVLMVSADGTRRLSLNNVTEGNPRGWQNVRREARRVGIEV